MKSQFTDQLSAMTPKAEVWGLLRAIVMDLWSEQRKSSRETLARLHRRREELQGRKDRLVEAFIHKGVIDQATYEEQSAKVAEERAAVEDEEQSLTSEDIYVQGVLDSAEVLLREPAGLWSRSSSEEKQRFQMALFPGGVSYPAANRLLALSATKTFPLPSTATPCGLSN